MGRCLAAPAWAAPGPDSTNMWCTPHTFTKGLFGNCLGPFSKTVQKCDLCGVHHANGNARLEKSWIPTCWTLHLCGEHRTDSMCSARPVLRFFIPKCDMCGVHHTNGHAGLAKSWVTTGTELHLCGEHRTDRMRSHLECRVFETPRARGLRRERVFETPRARGL